MATISPGWLASSRTMRVANCERRGRARRSDLRLEWSVLLVYPGQTFDTAIAVTDPTDVDGAVARFHRINAEARLIEARAQEPVVRGVRLTAVGEVEH